VYKCTPVRALQIECDKGGAGSYFFPILWVVWFTTGTALLVMAAPPHEVADDDVDRSEFGAADAGASVELRPQIETIMTKNPNSNNTPLAHASI